MSRVGELWERQGMVKPIRKHPAIAAALDMTPLIDIVFQLLIFFVMTFRLADQETEFHVRSPRSGPDVTPQATGLPTLRLAILADETGRTARVELNGQPMPGYAAVTERLKSILGNRELGAPGSNLEIEVACSPQLKHSEAIRALDTVAGLRHPDGAVTKFFEQIRFVELR